MNCVELLVFAPGDQVALPIDAQVRNLFATEYHSYHYMEQVNDQTRLRCLALDHGRVVGFAGADVRGRYATAGNLLVASSVRGRGIGRKIERLRHSWLTTHGLRTIVSCTCETTASQQLKLEIGMRPITIRFGFRLGVAGSP